MRGGIVVKDWQRRAWVLWVTTVLIPFWGRAEICEPYPIALPAAVLSNAAPGTVLSDIYQGVQPGNFGWLTWAGSPSEPTLVTSLALPGNSSSYVNPDYAADRQLSLGDWVKGKPGVSNSRAVCNVLEALKQSDITVPVWNETRGHGEGAAYRVSAFARIRILSYQLSGPNRITARFLGFVACDVANQPPVVDAGPDQTITLPATTTLNGTVTDDGLPVSGALTASWSVMSGSGAVTFSHRSITNAQPVTSATFSASGTYVLRLTASDSQLSASDEVIVTVNRDNHPPAADSQSLTNLEDAALDIHLTGGDADGDALSFLIVNGPSHGTLTGLPPQMQYTPYADYNGADSFTFKVNDGLLDSAIATLTITNVPVNDPPLADSQSLTVQEDTPLEIILSGADLEGSTLAFTVVNGPAHGTLSAPGGALGGLSNHLIYRPATNFNGPDSFTFVLNDGELASAPATVSITVVSINDVPLVDAGVDELITLPINAVTLAGTVTDDFFDGSTLTTQWSALSGPGMVDFSQPSATNSQPTSSATFSVSGIYTLRLTADDGFLIEHDDVIVTVNAPPAVNAGTNQTITLPASAILIGSASDDGIPTNTALTVAWSKVGGPGSVVFDDPASRITPVSFGENGIYVLRLTATDGVSTTQSEVTLIVNRAPIVDAGSDQFVTSLVVALTGTATDDGLPPGIGAVPLWTKVSGPGEVIFDNPSSPATSVTFSQAGIYVLRLSADDSLAAASDEVTIAINAAPVVNAGADQTILATDAVTLQGIVQDDGVPVGAPVTFLWELVTGPGTVILPNPNQVVTTAQFSAPGTYVFRLTASDSQLLTSDEVVITVLKPNEPPLVSAGQSQLVVLPAAVSLNGLVTDDGLPQGSQIAVVWSKASGPGSVTFANSTAPATTATFSEAGNYVLRLTASDSESSSFADVRMAVRTPAMNEAPVVNAGPNKTVGLTNAVRLCGTVVDDGLPQGAPLSVAWTVVSGPGTVNFENAGVTNAHATFSQLGTYVLRLSATDSSLSASDDVSVTVYPFNQPPIVDAGPDQTIVVPDPAVLLAGSGAPTNGNVSLSVSLSSAAQWNNQIGQPGLDGTIPWFSVAVSGTNVYAAGSFTSAGGTPVKAVARWDGQTWFALYDPRPSNPANPSSPSIGFGATGNGQTVVARGEEVFVRGGFADLDHNGHSEGTARWTGSGWESWYLRFTNTTISGSGCLAVSSNAVYQGGDWGFITNNTVDGLPIASYGIAKWTGTRWEALARGLENGLVRAIAIAPNGDVFAAGTFSFFAVNGVANNIARFNGTNWYALGNGLTGCTRFACHTEIYALAVGEAGDVYAGGDFTTAGTVSANFIARWDGATWTTLGSGANNGVDAGVHSISSFGPNIYVGGGFNKAGGFNARHLARWNGEFWSPIGQGSTNGVSVNPFSLAPSPEGMFVGGDFLEAGGLPASRIALLEFPVPPARGAVLAGHATDDGLPTDSTLSFQWTQVNGPGSVTFSDPTNAQTRATFSAVGTYVLRLTASDSDLTGFDEVTVTVRGNQPPVVSAGPDQTIGLSESVNLVGAVNDDGLPEGAALPGQWTLVHGPTGATVSFANPTDPNTTARFSAQGVYVLRLTANDSQFSASDDLLITVNKANEPPSVSIGGATAVTLPNGLVLTGTVGDDGLPAGVTNAFWTQVSGPDAVTFTNANTAVTRALFTTAGTYVLRLTGSDTELTTGVNRTITVTGANLPPVIGGPGNQPPATAAGQDRTVVTQDPVSLEGSAADDGLPAGSTLRLQWSAVIGPDRVYFADTRQPVTTASFNTPGTYVLRFSVNDGELTAYDDVTFTVVAPTNEAPFALAGPDLEVVRPNAAELFGVALDDGLPLGYPLISTWSKVSGPGIVTFSQPSTTNSQPLTSATFNAPGTYVLRLTASDSALSDFDDMIVTVQEGTNQPPVAHAGPDLAVALPNVAILPITATDDDLPQGILEVTWSKVSGPGNVSFSTLNGIYRAAFSAPGEYVLRLTANDTELTGTDDLTVTVYNEPHPPTVAILSPADSAIITAPTVVTGTVSSSILRSWQLEYRLQPAAIDSLAPTGGEGQGEGAGFDWISLATGSTTIAASPLATFDPTLLLNGLYELRLTATDLVGRTSATEPVSVIVDRNMKVGHFTLSFNDLTISVAGIPIQVIRTYDSRDKRRGDFGVGWTLDLKNIRLQKNRHLGRAWDQITTSGVFPNYCVSSSKGRVVTITFPDGRVQKFQMTLAPVCQSLSPLIYPDAAFVPIGGNTFGTLTPLFELGGEIVTDEQLVWSGAVPGRADFISYERLLNPPPGPADNMLFNPDLFEFRSQEGYRYVISETNGLRSVTDPNGNILTLTTNGITWTNATSGGAGLTVAFQRDALGRITNIVDALGHVMTYQYDTNSNLITFTDRDGNTNGFTYDGRHSLLTLCDGRGVQTVSNDYDVDGRLLRNTDASGHAIGYSYDLAGQRTFVTNRLGYVTVNEFDLRGNVIRTTNPLGAVSSLVYDENDNLLVKSNANDCACAVSYTYDQFDNRISETDARGNTTTYSHNALRKILRMTEPSGFSTTNTYDANGNLLVTIDSAGQRATFNYNSLGKVIAMTDPGGEVTRFAYNEAGFLTNEVNALGHVTEYEVDANGNRLSQAVTWSKVSAIQVAQAHRRAQGWMEAGLVPTPVTVVAGTNIVRLVMRHEYTPTGQPLRTLYYNSSSSSVRYNRIGKKECTTDQAGRDTCYEYDDQGRVQCITHPNGCQECFQYDAEGQMIRSTDRRGYETHYTYDPAGKLINTLFADGSQISASYFADGSLRSETAKNGEATLYEIDADGNRTSVNNSVGVTRYTYNYKKFATSKVDPLGRTNLYEYDALGRNTNVVYPNATTKSATFSGKLLTSETDQNGRTTSYSYDALGRLGAVTNAAGEVTRFTYDELGNKTSETDPLGHATFFEYDSMRRLTRTVYPDGISQSTQYDVNGRATSRTDQDGNVTRFGYDLADNVTAVTNAIGGVTLFTYDCGGNKLSQAEPDGKTTQFEYDSLSRLTRTLLPCDATETSTYDIAGRVVARIDANGKATQFDYDLRNNLVKVVDPLNRTNSFSYDAAGNRITETDANGQTTTFAYDGVDRRTRTTYSDTTFETYAYEGTGRFLAHTDQRGRTSTFENDAIGRLIAVTDPLGRVTRYGYDANGNRVAETNANNLVTRHEYDDLGRRTRTIYPDGSETILAYDRLGLLASETDAAGHTTFFAYDELRRLTGRQDHLGNVSHFGYDPVGRLTSQTDANNQTTTFEYDCLGRRNRIIYPDGSSQSEAYDLAGRRINEIDANTNASFFAYDASGRLLAATNALGHVTQFGYDALDRLISRTDSLGRITTFEYDALGRRTRTVYPDGAAQTTGYDTKGRRIRETDPAGNSTFYAYDDNDRLSAVTNALNQVTLYVYDATGRLISETDALGRATTFEYDALDRRTRTVFADGTSRVTTYDVLGRHVRDADQAGVATTYAYDAIGRLIGVTNALGQPTLYSYDPVGRLVAQTNADGQVTSFAYDSLGRRIRRVPPGGQSETYGYDPAGNLIRRTNFNGHVIQYGYDRLNRLTAKVPDAQMQAAGSVPVTYAYNPAGLRTNMTDAGGITDYSYDVRDRLIAKTVHWTLLSVPTTLSYGYDTNGNLAAIRSSNPNGADVTYTSDALNRLSAVHDSRLGPTTYSYDPVGSLQGLTRPNGIHSLLQYDSLYRLTNLGVSRAAAPVAGYEYTVGPAGHRLSALETLTVNSQSSTLHRSYGYDAAYRLTTEAISAAQHPSLPPTSMVTYEYDAVGNRIRRDSTLPTLPSAAHTYDGNNRLLSDRYDANGNTTNAFVFTPLTGQTNEVFDRFDFEDRLFERTTTLNSHPSTLNLLYDGDGNRVAKTVGGATHTNTTLYVVDDLNPTGYAQALEELTSADGEPFAVTRVYTWGHALLSQDQVADDGQGGLAWSASFHGHDGQGSVRFLTDTNGVVTDTFDYDAFGNLIARSVLNRTSGALEPFSTLNSNRSTPNNYLFRGEQFDPDLNFYYLRARYHNPATGRFWTPDSFEGFATDPASQHHYAFNQNDPVNRIDPSGHISLTETLQVSGLAPLVRGAFLNVWDGVNNFSYGMAGGNALKFTTREEAYFIDSLAVGPGWKFGKPNFWAAAKGAPFLLSLNPNIWQSKKPCYYDCIPFDQDVPVFGPGAQHPLFEFEQSPLYGLVEKIGHYGTAPVRFIGGAAVAAGVMGKSVADLVVNTGGAVSYLTAAGVYGPEAAEQFFGKQAEATAALALGFGRLNLATATLVYQPLLNVVAPEFAAEQRTLLGATAKAGWNGLTGGDAEYEGMGWEFRAGYAAVNLVGVVTGAAEVTQTLRVAKAARLAARLMAAERVAQTGAMRALRINRVAAEAAEAAAALSGPAKTGCRVARPAAVIDLVEGPDGVLVPVSELKNQRLLPASIEAQPSNPAFLESQGAGVLHDGTVSASAKNPKAYSTSIRADLGEKDAYYAALSRGEIGLQRPGGANVRGPDFITAEIDRRGGITVYVNDAKASTVGEFATPQTQIRPEWMQEVQDAIAPGRLDLGDPTLEAAIRDAVDRGRVKRRQINVDYSPAGQGKLSGL